MTTLMASYFGLRAAGIQRPRARREPARRGRAPLRDPWPAPMTCGIAVAPIEPEIPQSPPHADGLRSYTASPRSRRSRAMAPGPRAHGRAGFAEKPRAAWLALFAGEDCCVSPVLDAGEAPAPPAFQRPRELRGRGRRHPARTHSRDFSRSRPAIPQPAREIYGTRQPGGAGAMGSRPRAHREIDRERHRQQWRAGRCGAADPLTGGETGRSGPDHRYQGERRWISGYWHMALHFEDRSSRRDVPLEPPHHHGDGSGQILRQSDLVHGRAVHQCRRSRRHGDSRARGAGRTGLHLRGRPRRALDAAYGTSLSQCRDRTSRAPPSWATRFIVRATVIEARRDLEGRSRAGAHPQRSGAPERRRDTGLQIHCACSCAAPSRAVKG